MPEADRDLASPDLWAASLERSLARRSRSRRSSTALWELQSPRDLANEDAVLESLGEMGGSANAKWLMTIAGNNDESLRLRRRAVQLSDRAGTPVADLAQLYDRVDDPQMKEAIISTLANNGTKAATDKLLAIAKGDQNYSMRRRAVNALGRSEDPRVKEALKDIVEKGVN